MADFYIPSPEETIYVAVQNVPRYVIIPDPEDARMGTTYLGTPYYDQLVLKYRTAQATGISAGVVQTKQQVDSITFQTVLMEVTQSKNIQKTPISGKQGGTVKEYISDGDFYIRIQGAIISPFPNLYPKDAVRQMAKMCKIGDALEVESGFLGLFDINSVVIEEYKVSEKMGSRNMVPFELSVCSDRAIEFQLG